MRFRAAPSLVIVRREEKEAKLKDFIFQTLDDQATLHPQSSPLATWSVIARSIESPVLKALRAVAEERGRFNVRVAIALVDAPADAISAALSPISSDQRHLADPRHLNAHEQLILGTSTCWVGDCMRREPAKRDAYEQYVRECALTTAWAATVFERLWAAASPTLPTRATISVPPVAAPDLAVAAAALGNGGELPPTTAASTRH